jgi:molecular chaperone GrpE
MEENVNMVDENLNLNTNEEEEEVVEVEMVDNDKYLRLASEYENYKRRTTKEKEEYFKNANQKLLLDILPTLDNFERAGDLEEGILLIYTNLKNTLSRNGVKEIEAKGLVFNPDTMEAITQIPMEGMSGKVVDVVEKGYEISGKILRFSKVVVGS